MLSFHLYFNDRLKPLLNLYCEFGINKKQETTDEKKPPPEINRDSSSLGSIRNLWNEGRRWFTEDVQVTIQFVVEFPTADDVTESSSGKNTLNPLDEIIKIEESVNPEESDVVSSEVTRVIKPELIDLIEKILSENSPNSVQLCEEGIGGTYFIENEQGQRLAVFKPTDEEPGSERNPKGAITEPLLPPGGGAIREVAAYLLDRGFAGVPETHLISNVQHSAFNSPHPKSGSLQRYIENTENHDMSSSRFAVEDVHKIGILDIRLFNMDRNSENFLIQNAQNPKLIPIDHSYILPPDLNFVWFEWLHWKQAKQPFIQAHLDYIDQIDTQQDAEILKKLGFEPEAIKTMKISTLLLKIAALKFGYNLHQIGMILTRKKLNEESELERMVKKAESRTAEHTEEIFFGKS